MHQGSPGGSPCHGGASIWRGRQRIKSPATVQVPAWRELLQAFAAAPLPGAFAGLHSGLHRPLAAAVCSHATGFRALDRSGTLDMLHHLLQSTLAEVAQYEAAADGGKARAAAALAPNVRSPPLICVSSYGDFAGAVRVSHPVSVWEPGDDAHAHALHACMATASPTVRIHCACVPS